MRGCYLLYEEPNAYFLKSELPNTRAKGEGIRCRGTGVAASLWPKLEITRPSTNEGRLDKSESDVVTIGRYLQIPYIGYEDML